MTDHGIIIEALCCLARRAVIYLSTILFRFINCNLVNMFWKVLVLLISLAATKTELYIVDNHNKKTWSEGLLIAKTTLSNPGTVCDNKFSDTAATVICREMGWESGYSWIIQYWYDFVLEDIQCNNIKQPFYNCGYNTNADCSPYHSEDVFLNCSDCRENRYKTSSGCSDCPDRSTSQAGSTSCQCQTGKYWSETDCLPCQSGTYENNGVCTPCPSGSYSQSGSSKCEVCQTNYYSYIGSTNCTKCPSNYTSNPYQAFCVCPSGLFWNVTEEDCLECPVDHYNDMTNQTTCIPCPTHQTAAPGSDSCYSCTLGEFWENDTCLKCPLIRRWD